MSIRNRKPPAWADKDPDYALEAMRYACPVPSRRYILAVLSECAEPIRQSDLLKRLRVPNSLINEVGARLEAMARSGLIRINGKGYIVVKVQRVAGISQVRTLFDGRMSVSDAQGMRYELARADSKMVLEGDVIRFELVATTRDVEPLAKVVDVVESRPAPIVGQLIKIPQGFYLQPVDGRMHATIVIANTRSGTVNYSANDMVVARLVVNTTRQPGQALLAEVVEVIDQEQTLTLIVNSALAQYAIANAFDAEAMHQAEQLPDRVRASDYSGRVNLTHLPWVTVDGVDSRDFDDAVFAHPEGKGWRLFVAVADVSHYVTEDSPLDKASCARGNSVYFPNCAIPMLPHKLSNNLCSLNPKVNRLAMVVEMLVGARGKVKSYRICRAVIRSHKRLTYDEVACFLEQPDKTRIRSQPIKDSLQALYQVFLVLLQARHRRGGIEFESNETHFTFTPDETIANIELVRRHDAHKLIEECMLAANVSVADFLFNNQVPCLYRVHETPEAKSLLAARKFLHSLGLELEGKNKPTALHYTQLINKVKERPDAALIQTILLRSMQQAQYRSAPAPHFGLAYESYLHFTSPIRRYPDLLVHRALAAALDKNLTFNLSAERWSELARHCSQTERCAVQAERDVVQKFKAFYLQRHLGQVWQGVISGVKRFGLFVTLDDIHADGMIPVAELGQEFFELDVVHHRLFSSKASFQIGDSISVVIVAIAQDSGRITLAPHAKKTVKRHKKRKKY